MRQTFARQYEAVLNQNQPRKMGDVVDAEIVSGEPIPQPVAF